MKLREFLQGCKAILEEHPDALDMEMFVCHGASGSIEPVTGSPHTEEVDEEISDMLYNGYDSDLIVEIYIGD